MLLDAAGGGGTLVGLSSGAALAARAAAVGLPVRQLVMWEAPFRLDPEGQRAASEYAATPRADAGRRQARRRAGPLHGHGRGCRTRQSRVCGARRGGRPARDWRQTLAYDSAVMGDSAVPAERYAAITCPALVAGWQRPPAWCPGVGAGRGGRRARWAVRHPGGTDARRRGRCPGCRRPRIREGDRMITGFALVCLQRPRPGPGQGVLRRHTGLRGRHRPGDGRVPLAHRPSRRQSRPADDAGRPRPAGR